MSKTYRGEERRRVRDSRRAREDEGGFGEELDGGMYVRRSKQPAVITPEWAVERLERHINYELERLISEGAIEPVEKADFASRLRRKIVCATPRYTEEYAKRRGCGRGASAVHYFTVVVDNELRTIRAFLERRSVGRVEVPIGQLPADEAGKFGYVSQDSAEFSDECKNVRSLEFRMDLNTLVGMLKPTEHTVLRMLLEGYTQEEIGDRIGCTASNIRKTHIPGIRRKARLCGFIPPSEIKLKK